MGLWAASWLLQPWKEERSEGNPDPGRRTYAMMKRRARPRTRRTTTVGTEPLSLLGPAGAFPRGLASRVLGPANRNGLLDER
jgi:hypothetical protein